VILSYVSIYFLVLVLGEYLLHEGESLANGIPKLYLVEVMPIEYRQASLQRKIKKMPSGTPKSINHVRKNPRLQIYWDYTFSSNLTQAIFNRIVKDFKQKTKITIQNNPDRFIVYQFTGKPKIYLDKLTKKIYVTRGTLNYYSRQHCQQQASYVLRILKGTKKQRETRPAYASFKRTSVTCNPDRIGRTKEQREIYFKAVADLFNDNSKIRPKKIRKVKPSIRSAQ